VIGHLTDYDGTYASNYFSNTKNQDVWNKYKIQGGTQLWTMCPHIFLKRLNPLTKSFGTKQSHKNSYTIPKGPLEETCGEQTKAKMNASQSKITFIWEWKSLMKGGNQPQQVDGEGEGL